MINKLFNEVLNDINKMYKKAHPRRRINILGIKLEINARYSKSNIATAYTSKKLIKVRKQYVGVTTEKWMRELLQHEIMHIVATLHFKKSVGHSPLYRDLCKSFGFGKSVYSGTNVKTEWIDGYEEKKANKTKRMSQKYKIECAECGKKFGTRARYMGARYKCQCGGAINNISIETGELIVK